MGKAGYSKVNEVIFKSLAEKRQVRSFVGVFPVSLISDFLSGCAVLGIAENADEHVERYQVSAIHLVFCL